MPLAKEKTRPYPRAQKKQQVHASSGIDLSGLEQPD